MSFFRKSVAALVALLVTAPMSALAQEIPENKQMRIVVPYGAGGTSDILGRKLAQKLGEQLGRTIIVENKAGAGGSIGIDSVVRSDADGATLLLHSGAIATEPAIKSTLPYDVTEDLIPITTVVRGPFALLVSNNLPVNNVLELIDYAKANPDKVNFGTPGVGTSVHFASEHFKEASGAPITHVPYKGASASLVALMADEIQMTIDPLSTAKKYATAGKVKALAVTTAEKTSLWPEMNTVAESGVPDYDASVWYGMYVPADTPTATVEKLNLEMVKLLKSEDMVEWLTQEGLEPVADTSAQSKESLVNDIARWKSLAKMVGIQVE